MITRYKNVYAYYMCYSLVGGFGICCFTVLGWVLALLIIFGFCVSFRWVVFVGFGLGGLWVLFLVC